MTDVLVGCQRRQPKLSDRTGRHDRRLADPLECMRRGPAPRLQSRERRKTPIRSAEEAAVRVLIVEHEDELRMVLAEEFRRRGVEVFEATNEFEALWQSKHEHPDVILIDLTLPEFGS